MALIECPECGGKVSNSAVSCPHCGFPIKASLRNEGPFCPYCGNKNEPSSVYCRHCGKAMNGELADSFVLFQQSDPERDINVIALERSAKLSKQKAQEAQTALQAESVRLEQERFESMAKCPRCGSTSLSGGKRGFGMGKAVVGLAIAGPVGLLAGGVGMQAAQVTCMNCGYKFKPKES